MIFGMLAAGAVMAASAFAPMSAKADSLQNEKNNMRNLAILGGAAALYGITNGNSTMAVIGAAGAAVAGSQYEKDRQQQSRDNSWYGWDGGRYRHNWDNRNYDRNNNYDRNYNYNDNYGDYRDRGDNDNRDRDDNQYRDCDNQGGYGRYNHGNHYGWRNHE
jgi:hypothetical protein